MSRKIIPPRNRTEKAKFGFFLFLFTTLFTFTDFIINIFRSNIANDMDWMSWLYYIPSALGHASIFAFILYLVFYLPFSFVFKNYKVATTIYLIAAIILQMFIVLDGFVFNLYRFHFNGFVLELILGGGTEIFVFDFWVIIKFIFIVILVAVLPYLVAVFLSKRIFISLRKKSIRFILISLLLCIIISHVGHAVAAAKKHSSIQKSATAMPFFFPLTANKLLIKMGVANVDAVDQVYNVSSSDIQYPIHPIEVLDSIPNYNIVYIVVDSWNPRATDSITTPNINEFAKKGQKFEHHLSASYGTRGSIIGLFFGLSATYEKEIDIFKLSPVIIDRFIDLNYNIQAFPSASLTNPPFHQFIFKRVPDITLNSEGDSAFERDNYITKSFVDYIDKYNSDKPFFSFMFYDLPHAISIPKEYNKQFQPAWEEADYMKLNNDLDPTPFFNLYKNCVYHVDALIGQVVKKLEEKGMLENTIIIITGDHGQEFNENKKNFWGHHGNFSDWQLQIPFIFYYPGIEAGKTFSHTTTHYDITPTIMNRFLGVKNSSKDYSMGYDIYDTTNRYPHLVGSYVNYGFVFENMILKTNHLGTVEITDKKLNEIPRKSIKAEEIKKAIDLKNQFYKK